MIPAKETKVGEIQIRCSHDELVPIEQLRGSPDNKNYHPPEQIAALVKIITYQGWRQPVKVSRQSGCVTAGHGRLLAGLALGMTHLPVDWQTYDTPEQEYADVQADNAIALWAELDTLGIEADLARLGGLDVSLLGIESFDPDKLKGDLAADIEEHEPVESYSFTIKCDDLKQFAQLQHVFAVEGSSISWDKAMRVLA